MTKKFKKTVQSSTESGTPENVLNAMMQSMKQASPLYTPSAFWDDLARKHIKQLDHDGFKNFKRTLNMRYFNWGVFAILRHQFLPIFRRWMSHPSMVPFSAEFNDYGASPGSKTKSFDPITANIYRVYVAMLADFVADSDKLGLLDKLAEPAIGNPFVIKYRGRYLSQDLCNSVHEFYHSTTACDPFKPGFRIAELGAGYGRLGHVYLSVLPNASYCVIDIPPALYISQRYLTEIFPEEKVFKFREFNSFEDVRAEFENSRIRFLAAHQIELLPPNQFDLFINISSLHEMTREQVANYIHYIDRLCRGSFYTKQWHTSNATINGYALKESEYPIPANWKEVFHRQHPIQSLFFEALYLT